MMSDKVSKCLVVVFLTLLIWAWSYMSQQTDHPFTGTLAVSPSTDPSLLVTLSLPDGAPRTEIPLTTLNLKGAPSRLSDLSKRYTLPLDNPRKEKLEFYYEPKGTIEGPSTLNLLEYLQTTSKMRDLALTLESCSPTQVTVNIEKLVEKECPVQCLDKDGLPLPGANPKPAFVKIFVHEGYNESATVVLTPDQIENARKQPVEATPYVDLAGAAGIRRQSDTSVMISLENTERLKPQTFQPKSYRFVMSSKIANNYEVQLVDETFTGTTNFMATDEAMAAYDKMQSHVLVEIRDGDELLKEIPPRPVIYNFPKNYYKNGDIDIVEVAVPKTATFKLIPLNPEAN